MVFPYMDHDLAGLLENHQVRLLTPHIKQYSRQLLQGTHYLHEVRQPSLLASRLATALEALRDRLTSADLAPLLHRMASYTEI